MKKFYYFLAAIVLLIIAGYLCIRFVLFKTRTEHQNLKSGSVFDLRPLMINKLDELVKDGSDDLYKLTIERLEPDIAHSTIDVFNVALIPDSVAIRKLDSLKKLPDDIFRISFRQLHITHISPADFLHKQKIDIDTILVSHPVVQVYHQNRSYNEKQRKKGSARTLYQKLTQQFKSISIKAIVADKFVMNAGSPKVDAFFTKVSRLRSEK